MERTHSNLVVRHLTYIFVSAAAHFQAGGERNEAEDFELLCCVMQCVEYAKNKIVDESFIFLNVMVKLQIVLRFNLYLYVLYCKEVFYNKNKIPYSVLLNICPYVLEAVICLKLFFLCSSFMSGFHSFYYYGQCVFFLPV